jgi:hypothetical protein
MTATPIEPRRERCEAARDPYIARFEDGHVSPDSFDHAAHVQLGWRYLRTYDLPDAIARFRRALRRFVATHGAEAKYHETITVAYLLLIHERMDEASEGTAATWARAAATWDRFAAANPDLLTRGKHALARYYRAETLASDRARRRFVLPDRLAPAP